MNRAARIALPIVLAGAVAACSDNDYDFQPVTTRTQPTPVQVALAGAATQAGAGWAINCAVTSGGALSCWGANQYGQLGNGGAGVACVDGYSWCSNGPVAVTPPPQWQAVSGGIRHACGLDAGGMAWCWGANGAGQLGTGNTTGSSRPAAVSGGLVFSRLSVSLSGDMTCGIAAGNALYCWGAGYFGQAGIGGGVQTSLFTVPHRVGPTQAYSTVAVGEVHNCALDAAGAAWCWGGNFDGQVGDGTNTHRDAPTATLGGRTYTQITSGVAHTCALDAAGVAYCWGAAAQLGRAAATAGERATPAPVTGAQRFVRIAAGGQHTCGLEAGGQLWCWGSNVYSQFGDGGTASSIDPRRIDNVPLFATLVAGGGHTCGITAAGAMYCWGATTYGQRGSLP